MAKYADKWKKTFPESIGNEARPTDGVDNTQEFNTDAVPQYMANDPVRYDLQNAINSQLLSNDERLKEKFNQTNIDLGAHNKDPKAHATGIAGNAASASKLQTARTISLSGKAEGSATFDGSSDVNIKVTEIAAGTSYKLSTPREISLGGDASGSAKFDGSADVSIEATVNQAAHANNADTAEKGNWKGKADDKWYQMAFSLDSNFNYQSKDAFKYNPATNVLKVGTVQGNLSGNANTATTATKAINDGNGDNIADTYLKRTGGTMTGALALANYTWNGVGDDGYIGDHNITGTVCFKGANGETGIALVNRTNEADYARISYSGGNINFNKTIGGNITGNAGSANVGKALQIYDGSNKANNSTFHWVGEGGQPTWLWGSNDGTNAYVYNPSNFRVAYATNANGAVNADKLDGFHAADLYRYIGGHGDPVLTDIFDRAGTIDLSALTASEKVQHKSYINKQTNMTQNLWNTNVGIYAYGGDTGMLNGYGKGTLKLTQPYTNFDKIMIVSTSDDASWISYAYWDVFELRHAFANSFAFNLFQTYGYYWIVYGTQKHGTEDFKWSSDTIWSCRTQGAGIIAIYGIKY